jgi:hypothetical protein
MLSSAMHLDAYPDRPFAAAQGDKKGCRYYFALTNRTLSLIIGRSNVDANGNIYE